MKKMTLLYQDSSQPPSVNPSLSDPHTTFDEVFRTLYTPLQEYIIISRVSLYRIVKLAAASP